VKATAELGASAAGWRRSSYSAGEGNCVEMATLTGGVAIRDSKDTGRMSLRFGVEGWAAFCRSVNSAEL
jgi:hypothetical protein